MTRNIRWLLVTMALTLALAGVPAGAALAPSVTGKVLASAPVILSVEPDDLTADETARRLTIRGEDFRPGLVLEVQSPDGERSVLRDADIERLRPTSFEALVSLPVHGRYFLTVTNPDGGVSDPFPVEVRKADERPTAPVITRVDPETLEAGPEPQALRVEGRLFDSGLTALVTDPIGTPVPDVSIADLSPTSFVLTARFETRGDYELVVTLPSGATSNVVQILVR